MTTSRPNILTFHQITPGQVRWTLRAPNGEVISASTEAYVDRRGAYANVANLFAAELAAGRHTIPDEKDAAAVTEAVEARYGEQG